MEQRKAMKRPYVYISNSKLSLSRAVAVLGLALLGCSLPFRVSLNEHDRHYSRIPNPNLGLVYIYREDEWIGSGRGMYITANGKRVGGLNTGTYVV